MSRIVDYVIIFDDGIRKRHYHEAEKGKVIHFVVQLEVKVENQWKVVIRYDCAHGFSHVDQYDRKGNQSKMPLGLSFENALSYGDWDVNEHWVQYTQEFLKGK
jgi:hypothetical protein